MQVTETLNEGLKRELKVNIPATALKADLDKKIDDLKGKVQLKGFRPGKVPAKHIKRVYGKSLMAELIQEKISKSMNDAVEARQEKAAYQPEVDLSEDEEAINKVIAGDADLDFVLKYEVFADFELAESQGLQLVQPEVDIDEQDIQSQFDKAIAQATPVEPKKDGAQAEHGDRLTLSYAGTIDGESFQGGQADEAQLELGSNTFIPGFEDQLLGAKVGDKKTVKVTFPNDYGAENLAGKKAEFACEIKKIEEKKKIDDLDEFVKTLGLESVEKGKETLKAQILAQYKGSINQHVKRQILDKLDEAHDFELPQKLVDQEFNGIWQQVMYEIEHHGKSFEDEGTTEEEARADYQRIAKRRVRLGLVLARYGDAHEITLTEEDIQKAVTDEIKRNPGREKEVWDYFRKNEHAVAALRAPAFEQKAIAHILDNAKVTKKKVTAEELAELIKKDEESI